MLSTTSNHKGDARSKYCFFLIYAGDSDVPESKLESEFQPGLGEDEGTSDYECNESEAMLVSSSEDAEESSDSHEGEDAKGCHGGSLKIRQRGLIVHSWSRLRIYLSMDTSCRRLPSVWSVCICVKCCEIHLKRCPVGVKLNQITCVFCEYPLAALVWLMDMKNKWMAGFVSR